MNRSLCIFKGYLGTFIIVNLFKIDLTIDHIASATFYLLLLSIRLVKYVLAEKLSVS